MYRGYAAGLALMFAVAACSGPPTAEHQQAESAIAAARAADAATYAPDDLQQAEAALKQYDDAVAQRDYRQALNHALEARDRAYDAVKSAGAAKADARAQVDRQIPELEGLTRTASARLAGPSKPTGQAGERLRSALTASTAALQEARSRLASGDVLGAAQLLQPAIANLRRELAATEPPGPHRKK
jgi:hypothetical protein